MLKLLQSLKRNLLIFPELLSNEIGQYFTRRYFSSIQNKHQSCRGFVICNGPSLKFDDLNKLASEISIASNKIYLCFPHTHWRPDYFTIQDPLVWKKVKQEIPHYFEHVHIENTPYLPVNNIKKIKVMRWNALAPVQNPYVDDPKFSPDIRNGICGGYSVTYANLQFAVHLGLNPIYLIGCDHNYQGEPNLPANTKLEVKENQENHFIKGYREPGEIVYNAPLDDLTEAYKNAKAYSDQNDISIINATRGGFLEVFERVDFDTLFN